MKIFNSFSFISSYQQNNHRINYPNLAPLKYDTVSFRAVKKNEFKGVDIAVVEKYKVPIEKFKTNNDFNNWTNAKCKEIITKDYSGRQEETEIQRKAMLKEWSDYVLVEDDVYSPAMHLIIMDSITKDLKANTDKLPPVLNKRILADTVEELEKKLTENPKQDFEFNKMYNTKLSTLYLEDTDTGETGTKWIKIPSKGHDKRTLKQMLIN